ncbi:hypothetical protein B296_00052235 [Ensete ventricosum]|uniref:Uncharacterized protein n=1 Tax=Ensete ventricosum TaxID=4639 RepID=A0A426X6J6_ENSVE|nr:hypothetical protein B296_00052235 [Ensete ventricosum]
MRPPTHSTEDDVRLMAQLRACDTVKGPKDLGKGVHPTSPSTTATTTKHDHFRTGPSPVLLTTEGALGAMLVYDITERKTFDHVVRWIDQLRANADNSIVVMLIGNKSDLAQKRVVSTQDAMEFAEEQGLFFSEASALGGDNVETAFLRLLEEIYME